MTETEERLSALEQKLERYDALLAKLIAFARVYPAGRALLKGLGL